MKFIVALLSIFILLSCNSDDKKATVGVEEKATAATDGETLFKANCASCHRCDMDFTGPALRGSMERWTDKKLLFEFIREPQKVIMKDVYAKNLLNKYQSAMTAFPQLSDADIQAILNYCK
jgi:mono/diheme cytochrome c family protein